jgi:hypothetical protein
MQSIRTVWPVRAVAVVVLMGMSLSGCGRPTGSVSGKVTYQGKPLTSGLVIFVDKDGFVSQPAGIEVDGSYAAQGVYVGPTKVCVETHPLSGGDGGPALTKDGKEVPRARYVPIPAKYKDAKQTELSLDVKSGANLFDIEVH